MVSIASLARVLCLAIAPLTARASSLNYKFDLRNTEIAPDGFHRAGVIVNGQFPGPIIQANKDDTVRITVNDQLTDPSMRRSTSIHWHGLFEHRTADEDGTSFVTQCPISPGHSFTYNVPLNGQAGTYWYHSHLHTQYTDGLRGAMIIYDPVDPHMSLYDVDDASTVITLADWYHTPAPALQDAYQAGNLEPVPDSGLINGKGRYVGGPEVVRARINVQSGKRYRFRVINMSAYAAFRFSIEGHPLTIIEVDGANHVPHTVDGFDIYAAQRYSVVLHANQPVKNYWIHGPMTVHGAQENPEFNPDDAYAVLHYAGAPNAEPENEAKNHTINNLLQEYQLKPLENPGAPGGKGKADMSISLKYDQTIIDGELRWTINGVAYEYPDLPTLLNILSHNTTKPSDFARSENTIILEKNKVIELIVQGSRHGNMQYVSEAVRPRLRDELTLILERTSSPFHLHGHKFDIIQSINGPPNYVDPPRRDVVAVGSSPVIIRFRTDNPGPWFFHCHIDWHLDAGMAVVFAEAPEAQRKGPQSEIIQKEWLDLCPIYNALPEEDK